MLDMEPSNLSEKWSRWESILGLEAKYNVVEIVDGHDGVKIKLISYYDQSLGVELEFEAAWAYRVSYDSLRFNIIDRLTDKYGSDFYVGWTFFKVNNSDYLDWLDKESYGTSDGFQLTHYFIMGMEQFIDIASGTEPIVRLIKL